MFLKLCLLVAACTSAASCQNVTADDCRRLFHVPDAALLDAWTKAAKNGSQVPLLFQVFGGTVCIPKCLEEMPKNPFLKANLVRMKVALERDPEQLYSWIRDWKSNCSLSSDSSLNICSATHEFVNCATELTVRSLNQRYASSWSIKKSNSFPTNLFVVSAVLLVDVCLVSLLFFAKRYLWGFV